MIRKFAMVSGFRVVLVLIFLTILAGAATVHAQQAPAQQTQPQQPPAQQPPAQTPPDNQQAGSQEPGPEEEIPARKPKPRGYKNWTFNLGGGTSFTSGTTQKFVRSGGGVAAAGVARNYSKYFGLRADFQWDNLPLRTSAMQAAQAPGATSHVYSFTLDPIVNFQVTRLWGGYVLGGPAFYHRSGKLDSSTAIPGSACNPFFTWWGSCTAGSLPLSGRFLKANQNEFGENFGAGITRKIRPNIDFYAEFRFFHGKHGGTSTDLRPITIGFRW
jgi:hypothetical protein